ncbi:MAG: tryptophan--tRNA ligase [Candidatus Aenigmarchaeota archaeon]|nr:tryptophan--tRNA ligase [Candidatus Aenigmarchaeota archaeon]
MAQIDVANMEGDIDYDTIMKEFGVEPFDRFLPQMKKSHLLFRRKIIFAHRGFGHILAAMHGKKPFAVVGGFNPSGNLHVGNKIFMDQLLFYQDMGGQVFIPISNDETYVFGKTDKLESATDCAMKTVIPNLIALGLDPKKTKIFISTKTSKAYELAVKLSAKTTFSSVKAIFGFDNQSNPGKIFYSVMQTAHILFPQLEEYGGPKPVVVSIGIDQDPYMRLARDLAEKIGFEKPSSTYNRFLIGLQGGKMSGSKPHTAIFLDDDEETVRKKIIGAFSGGGASLKEHREKGGNPDIDAACQYLKFGFEPDDKKLEEIFAGYRNGSVSTGDVKNLVIDRVTAFLKQHHNNVEKARKQVDKFLIAP